MASLTLNSFDAVLKQHYTDQRVKNLVYEDNALLAMLPKMESFGGRNLPVPIQYGIIAGRAGSLATAIANAQPSQFEDFLLTRDHDYAYITIDNEAMEASVGDKNAFLAARVTEINAMLHALARSLAIKLYRSGTGSVGTIATVTGDVDINGAALAGNSRIVLANVDEITNFEVNDKIGASATDGGAIKQNPGGTDFYATVVRVDRSAGAFQISTDVLDAGFADDWAVGDFLHKEGDAQDAGTRKVLVGLSGWLPASNPSVGESFFGVDRSVDTRLSGVRYDGSGETVQEALIGAALRLRREGGRPTHVFMNPKHLGELLRTFEGQVTREATKSADAPISFEAVMLRTPGGTVRVHEDYNCPPGVAYMLDMRTWKLYSLGPAPKIYRQDGLTMLRQAAADGAEVRGLYYAQLGCDAPGNNCRITLAN